MACLFFCFHYTLFFVICQRVCEKCGTERWFLQKGVFLFLFIDRVFITAKGVSFYVPFLVGQERNQRSRKRGIRGVYFVKGKPCRNAQPLPPFDSPNTPLGESFAAQAKGKSLRLSFGSINSFYPSVHPRKMDGARSQRFACSILGGGVYPSVYPRRGMVSDLNGSLVRYWEEGYIRRYTHREGWCPISIVCLFGVGRETFVGTPSEMDGA